MWGGGKTVIDEAKVRALLLMNQLHSTFIVILLTHGVLLIWNPHTHQTPVHP